MRKMILFLAVLVSFGAFAQQKKPLVSVFGEGTVNTVPDRAIVNARVEHTGESVKEVKSRNDEVLNEILDYLESQGISSKNIRTEYINLRKEHDYNTKNNFYAASQTISIRLDDLEIYEEIMSGLLQSGLNRIDGVRFRTSGKETLESEARKKAVIDARKKATEYAAALGQEIGKAEEIHEVESSDFRPMNNVMEMKSDDSGADKTIAPGELEVIVKVKVSFILL